MGTIGNIAQNPTGDVGDGMFGDPGLKKRHMPRSKPLLGAYGALLLFMIIYCARPEDWIPGLSHAPLAKIAGTIALVVLIFSLTHIRRRLPREVLFLGLLIGQLFLAAAMSTVWRGGALQTTLDFSKTFIIVVVINAAVNTSQRLRWLMFVQAASVAVIAGITVWKGHLVVGRLEGILGGNYSNPNDLALAIIISLPLCLASLFLARNTAWKVAWALAMIVMSYAVFLTGSRGGFLALIVAAAFCLWDYAVRGRRLSLFILTAFVGVILWQFSSGLLSGRLNGTFSSKEDVASSYDSAQQRKQLFWRTVQVTEENPLFGVGAGNFEVVSGAWRVSHNSFTQMSAEGGVPALFFYLLILWCGFRNTGAIIRGAQGQRELIILAQAVRASLAGYVVGAAFGSTAYQFFPYILVAYTTGLVWLAKGSAARRRASGQVDRGWPENAPFSATSETERLWHPC